MPLRFLLYAVCLHVMVIIFAINGLPWLTHKPDDTLAMPVELVTDAQLSELTSKPHKVSEADTSPAPAPPKVAPPPPPPQEQKPTEEQPKVEAPKPEPQPEAEPIPTPDKKPEPKKTAAKPAPLPKARPKSVEQQKPQKDQKQQEADFSSLLKDLTPQKDTSTSQTPADQQTTGTIGSGTGLEGKLTMSEMDALRAQIASCWNIPIGARDMHNMTAEIRIEMNLDRTVRKAEVVDKSRMNVDPAFRTLAESALRAMRNSKCSPLLVPQDKFPLWQTFTLVFDPRKMLNP